MYINVGECFFYPLEFLLDLDLKKNPVDHTPTRKKKEGSKEKKGEMICAIAVDLFPSSTLL